MLFWTPLSSQDDDGREEEMTGFARRINTTHTWSQDRLPSNVIGTRALSPSTR